MPGLQRWLDETETTQKSFGEQIRPAPGVSQATVSDWIRGVVSPAHANLVEIMRITELSFDELHGEKKRKNKANGGGSERRAAPG